MATLPTRSAITSSTTTNSQQKVNFGDQRDFIADLLGTDSADKSAARAALGVSATGSGVPVRQTVLFGPVDSNGLPAFGGSTGGTTVTTTAISASAPLVVSAANGFNAQGAVNNIGQSTSNLAFSGLSTNGTMYLYVDIAAGVLTPGAGTLVPAYQPGGTYSITNNQFTFNQSEMVGKVGNGSAAVQTNRVYVGQVTVAGNVVTAIVWYALQGQYIGPYNTPLPGTATAMSQNHNIGVVPESYDLVLECVSGELGYQAGVKIKGHSIFTSDGSGRLPMSLTVTRVNSASITGASSPMASVNQTSGAGATLTAASWKWKFIASRGW